MARASLRKTYGKALSRTKENLIETFHALVEDKLAMSGLIILIAFVLMGLIGPFFIPPPTPSPNIYAPPSLQHPFGTDFQGEDIFAKIVYGTTSMLIIAFVTGIFITIIAVLLGSIAGYLGGYVDNVIMGFADILLAIPQLPLFLILAVLVKFLDIVSLALLISALSWPTAARAFRSQFLSLKERDFVEASRLLGFNSLEIIVYDLIPNILPYILINVVLNAVYAIYIVTSLAYLGIIPFESNNWGIMLYQAWAFGTIYNKRTFMYIMAPIGAIVFLQLGLLLFSRALEVIFNPRVRTGE